MLCCDGCGFACECWAGKMCKTISVGVRQEVPCVLCRGIDPKVPKRSTCGGYKCVLGDVMVEGACPDQSRTEYLMSSIPMLLRTNHMLVWTGSENELFRGSTRL
uniref:Uncharacterized protein n=1 Tax=Arundo donax TaxID=35708 RepID=A0A0A9FZY8_ARUDO